MIRVTLMTAILLAIAPCFVLAEDNPTDTKSTAKSFDIPSHGALWLSVPAGWTSVANQPMATLPPTIEVAMDSAPGKRPACQMLITPAPSRTKDGNSPANLKRAAEARGKQLLPGSKEQSIDLKELKGEKAKGYYFTVTDQAPNPGEYENMTCAFIGVGDLALGVTILHHQNDSPELQAALNCLKSASQGAGAASKGPDEKPKQKGEIRVPPLGNSDWELVLFSRDVEKAGPDQIDPVRKTRRVFFENADAQVEGLVFIQPALNDGDSTAVRDAYWKRTQRGLIERGAKFGKAGDYATIEYTLPDIAGRPIVLKDWNISIVHEGFWIDVQFSKSDFAPADEAQFRELLKSIHFEKRPRP